jgi:hypothetical protein
LSAAAVIGRDFDLDLLLVAVDLPQAQEGLSRDFKQGLSRAQ